MAFACHYGKLDGVYRMMANGSVSVFIGYRLKSFFGKDGNETAAETFVAEIETDRISRAQAHCDSYDAEMLGVDEAYNALGDNTKMKDFLDQKNEVYSRYWKRNDNFWTPCSFSWPSEHDINTVPIKFTGPVINQAALIGRIHGFQKTIYHVEFFDGEPKITDNLIEWGRGFIWPD